MLGRASTIRAYVVVDVVETTYVEWMKTCKLFGKIDNAFLYTGMPEKYRVDLVETHKIYKTLRTFASGVNNFTEIFATAPISDDLPSLMDELICVSLFLPCSESCEPVKPCRTILNDAFRRLASGNKAARVLETDCKSANAEFDLNISLNYLDLRNK